MKQSIVSEETVVLSGAIAEIEALVLSNNGRISPEDIVEYARDPSTALHSRFEWDDSEASRLYRIQQARDILRISVRVMPGSNTSTRVFVSLKGDRGDTASGSYRMMVDVLTDDDLREKLLSQAYDDFVSWKKRYEHLKDLVPVFDAMDAVRNK